ncbi:MULTISPECIES: hypothetical protein [unclassified Marinitoga]|uniref:hypothetical protein n=1 Tax=unclassified Marinitoga TaxID=2640159 RepID=UPI000640F748|nr:MULTISPECIES: hypothetical protein [unclassified Marinitoga]KLO24924.1 hypothetical protein X274_01305 [Marinitoga sp. 1155]NUU99038.1 hypothetical protein [Marinitoga sp. 1154]
MPDPINLSISYITNVDISNNIQNLNNALLAARTTNLEEHIKKNEEAKSQVKNTDEKSESKNINADNKGTSQEYKQRQESKKENAEKKRLIVDEYRGHSLDIRI